MKRKAPLLACDGYINNCQTIMSTVRIPDNGAAVFRLPVPAWIPDEQAAAQKGMRTLIVLLHAEQQKE